MPESSDALVAQDADGVTLTSSSGRPVRAGVVVAADGIHSVLREHVTTASPPRESGLCAWRSLVPAAAAPAFAGEDPLSHNAWLYGYDAEQAAAPAAPAG